jgi:secreted trypsin-like serine protease
MRAGADLAPRQRRTFLTATPAGRRWRCVLVATIAAAAVVPAAAHAHPRVLSRAAQAGTARREPHRAGPTAHAAVIDGSTAAPGTWPWLAFVANVQLSTACSGTVVSPMVVLTAAHCAEDINSGALYPPSAFGVVTGALDWTAAGGAAIKVAAVEIDPGFDRSTLDDDVAVLVLASPTRAPALPLATPADSALLAQGTSVAVAGWGNTFSSESPPPTALHWGASVVQGATYCTNEEYIDGVPFDPSNDLCALDAPSLAVATCHGDSGGPLVASDASGDPVAIGITSRGDPLCNPDFPSVFTRADAISAWVQSVVAANPLPAVQVAVAPAPLAPAPPVVPAAGAGHSRQVKLPAAGAYAASGSSARGRVSIDVSSPRGARARVQLHFTLACPRRRFYTTALSVAPVSNKTGGWHFSAQGTYRRRWQYTVSGTFRAPGTIAGTFTVKTLNGRCSTGRVSWRSLVSPGHAGARRRTGALDIRSSVPNNAAARDISLPEAQSTTEAGDDSRQLSQTKRTRHIERRS